MTTDGANEALFAVAPYVDRDYAPIEERARRQRDQAEARQG